MPARKLLLRDMAFHKKSGLRIEDMVSSRWVYRKLGVRLPTTFTGTNMAHGLLFAGLLGSSMRSVQAARLRGA
ncbi:hypothetical protein N183_35635 [Sinorhizobium sp. Sb3]|nr:hypothetical protein N183_35635 [Sinorhizobium sp. Sb3]